MFLLKTKYIIPLAVATGLIATYTIYDYLQQQEENLKKPVVVTRGVVVAANNLSIGTTLRDRDLELKEWPEDIIPPGSFHDLAPVLDRVIKTDVIAGEAILDSKLAPVGSSGGLSSLIPHGMRAISVAVNVVSGVSGFILPKSWVDVLATVAPSNDKEKTFTQMILENVQVLAVDQTFKKNDDDPMTVQSVTLLVTPEEAERLTLASNEGKLQLMLRNTADAGSHETEGVLLSQLLKRPKPKPTRYIVRKAKPEPKVQEEKQPSQRIVEVIRSNVRSELTFEEEESTNGKAEESNTRVAK